MYLVECVCAHSNTAKVQLDILSEGKIVNKTDLVEIGQMRQQPVEAVVPELYEYLGALVEMVVDFSNLVERARISTCFFMTLP